MAFNFFKRKDSAMGADKPRFWEFKKKRALQMELNKRQMGEQANKIADITVIRDEIINRIIKHLEKQPGEEEWAFQHRLNSARGLAFNDPKVLEVQRKINEEIEKFCRLAKIKLGPNSLREKLGGDFEVKNLGWSGAPFGPLGKTPFPDLGIYRKRN